MRGDGFPDRAARCLSLLLYSPAQDGKHVKWPPAHAEHATNLPAPLKPSGRRAPPPSRPEPRCLRTCGRPAVFSRLPPVSRAESRSTRGPAPAAQLGCARPQGGVAQGISGHKRALISHVQEMRAVHGPTGPACRPQCGLCPDAARYVARGASASSPPAGSPWGAYPALAWGTYSALV